MNKIETVETDILIIGGGPAGLATAIHLADLFGQNQPASADPKAVAKLPIKIMLLEKGAEIGDHSISGAVINPGSLKELLPDIAEKDMPFETPVLKEEVHYLVKGKTYTIPFELPYFSNKGNYIASLGKVTRWLAGIAVKKGVQIYSNFTGSEIIYENGKVAGVRTGASGIDHKGAPMDNYQPPTDVRAKITIFAEGTRGSLTKTLVEKFNLGKDRNPQVYSLGVKEVWEVPAGAIEEGYVAHTMGYPLTSKEFGGGFIYGMHNNLVAIGIVAGLDYSDPTFDLHSALQVYKKHPFIANIIKNGKIVRYGAKTIPEGGLFSVPQLYHDNALIVGDSAGLLAMPSLKGIHLAVKSGMLAAKTTFEALKKNDTSLKQLSLYEKLFNESTIYKELYPVRNFRAAFQGNLLLGMFRFGIQMITGGRGLSLSGKLKLSEDFKHYQTLKEINGSSFQERMKDELVIDKITTFDKDTDVFYSGTKHDEEQPSHIKVLSLDTCQTCIDVYGAPCQGFCSSQVFEVSLNIKTGKKGLTLHPSNCLHCKTCDIKDPHQNVLWTVPYGGDGPEYGNM